MSSLSSTSTNSSASSSSSPTSSSASSCFGSEYSPSPSRLTNRQTRRKFARRRMRPSRQRQKFRAKGRRRSSDYGSEMTAPTDCSSGCASLVVEARVMSEAVEDSACIGEKLEDVKRVISRKRKAVDATEKLDDSMTDQKKSRSGGSPIALRPPVPTVQLCHAESITRQKRKAANSIERPDASAADKKKPKKGKAIIEPLRPLKSLPKAQNSSFHRQTNPYKGESQQNPTETAKFPVSQLHRDSQNIFPIKLLQDFPSPGTQSPPKNGYGAQQSEFFAKPSSQDVVVFMNQHNQHLSNLFPGYRGGFRSLEATQNRRQTRYGAPTPRFFNGYREGRPHNQTQGRQGRQGRQGQHIQFQGQPAPYLGRPAQYQGQQAQSQDHQFQGPPGLSPAFPQLQDLQFPGPPELFPAFPQHEDPQFQGLALAFRQHQDHQFRGLPGIILANPQHQDHQFQGPLGLFPAYPQHQKLQFQGPPRLFSANPQRHGEQLYWPLDRQPQGPEGHFQVGPQSQGPQELNTEGVVIFAENQHPQIQTGMVHCQPQPRPNPLGGVQLVSNLNPLNLGPGSTMQLAPDSTFSAGTTVFDSPALINSIPAASPGDQGPVIFEKSKRMPFECCADCKYFRLVSHDLCSCGCLFPGSAELYAEQFYSDDEEESEE